MAVLKTITNKCPPLILIKVGDIKHNPELSKMAQHWAEHLAETNILKHSNDTYKGDQLGENVASRWSSAGADYTGRYTTR